MLFTARDDVWNVAAFNQEFLDVAIVIAFVQADVLFNGIGRWRREWHLVEGCGNQSLIVRIGSADGESNRQSESIPSNPTFA